METRVIWTNNALSDADKSALEAELGALFADGYEVKAYTANAIVLKRDGTPMGKEAIVDRVFDEIEATLATGKTPKLKKN